METKLKKLRLQKNGFTLIELLVVIAIWMIVTTIVLINYTGQRAPRDVKIASNELSTNIRKVQSYALSSRNTPNGNAARYYLLQFNQGATSYSVSAMDNQTYSLQNVQTIFLPSGVKINNLFLQQPAGANALSAACVQVAFGLPYGKVYVDPTCNFTNLAQNPTSLAAMGDSTVILLLKHKTTSSTQVVPMDKFVSVNGVTGSVNGYDAAPSIPGLCFNNPSPFSC